MHIKIYKSIILSEQRNGRHDVINLVKYESALIAHLPQRIRHGSLSPLLCKTNDVIFLSYFFSSYWGKFHVRRQQLDRTDSAELLPSPSSRLPILLLCLLIYLASREKRRNGSIRLVFLCSSRDIGALGGDKDMQSAPSSGFGTFVVVGRSFGRIDTATKRTRAQSTVEKKRRSGASANRSEALV